MSHARRFAFGELGIRVVCRERAHLVWLEEFLAPAFTVDDDSAAACSVELVVDPVRHRALAATRPAGPLPLAVCFVLDQGALCAPWWSPSPGERVIADDEHQVIYVIHDRNPHVQIVSLADSLALRRPLMRVVRELAMTAAWTRTTLVLHAAAFGVGDRGIVIAGPKHAGKTSLLIHCLSVPDARYVSNDRVVVQVSAGTVTLRGMPTIVAIRDGTLRLFPELHARLLESGFHSRLTVAEAQPRPPQPFGGKPSGNLSPVQLCRLLGVPLERQVEASVVLLPRIDSAADGIVLRLLSAPEASARLRDVLFAATAATRTSEVFSVGSGGVDAEPATQQQLWRDATTHLRAFECRLGRTAFHATPVDLLDRVLAASPAATTRVR